jgi:Dynamin family
LGTSFNAQLDRHGAWRREFAQRLKQLSQWMQDHELLESDLAERLNKLEALVRSDKLMVAFVAEFSRGKSEMINAVFFAGYGRRIMPASAGRTTMCPTEMGYDPAVPACLRLLPIETRLQTQALMEWRMVPEKWTQVELDVNNPQQLAEALAMVAQTIQVSQEQARALGFWNDQTPQDNPLPDAQGLVEVPRWRHALINIAHPLLRQGLVILDTPGLNAIGAEPELTLSLIAQAQAVVFILGADTGVTKSDLAIWREHVEAASESSNARLVVLNKIDTLWDELSTPQQIAGQLERQRASTADILGIAPEHVLAVSAQKALVAKVNNDAALLERSGMNALEHALGQGLLQAHQQGLQHAVQQGAQLLRQEADRLLQLRSGDVREQIAELTGLQGKNTAVIRHMRARIAQEQAEFDLGGARIQAVRSVHLKLLKDVFDRLGAPMVRTELASLAVALGQKGLKLGVKKAYAETFSRLRGQFDEVQRLASEIHSMLAATFRQLNTEYGFSLQPLAPPSLDEFRADLDRVERGHVHYLGLGNLFRLSQPEFTARLVRALGTRVRAVCESALADLELWSKSAGAQLDLQLRERRRNFARRMEAMDRIQQAAGGLELRIGELMNEAKALHELQGRLADFSAHLLAGELHDPQGVDLEIP